MPVVLSVMSDGVQVHVLSDENKSRRTFPWSRSYTDMTLGSNRTLSFQVIAESFSIKYSSSCFSLYHSMFSRVFALFHGESGNTFWPDDGRR